MSGVYFYLGLVVLSLLSISCVVTSDSSLGSRRSILRAVKNNVNNGDLRDYAVDLNATNFDAVLKDTPATFAIVEFFAHWCPACRIIRYYLPKYSLKFEGYLINNLELLLFSFSISITAAL
ncbi:sulfhydryl oxidase 2-like [Prosopis cineraria]|uniref:sulfhydryl oxidase 2-like n=1 Tax=Prosopis cineraria TaxID=364024 RepID=UPI0024104089|nr:sulfhydryl oxidase 2-like [Prosopis cineraria]